YLADGEEVKLTQGDYAFNDFVDNQVEVYSKWKTLVAYQQPYDISVNVSQSGNTITITWKLDLFGQVQPNFNLYIDKVLISDYTSLVTQDGLVFTLVITSEHPDHAKFIKLTETGLHSVSIQAIGDQEDTTDSILSDEFIFERKSIYDDAPENTAIYDYFIIEEFEESTRYIFYTNMTYQFNVLYTFEILSGSDLVSIENGSTLKMKNIAGSFKFKMTRPNGTSDTYDALIVKDIKQFGYGSNYQTYLTETSGASTYIDTDVPYYVGAQNNFYLDARLTNSQGNRINIDDAILTYKFYIKTGVNTWIEIDDEDLADHLSMQPKNRIKFKNAAIGNTYQIEI